MDRTAHNLQGRLSSRGLPALQERLPMSRWIRVIALALAVGLVCGTSAPALARHNSRWGQSHYKSSVRTLPAHESPTNGLSAEAVALIDVGSGRLLFEKNGDKKMRIASLTKVVTGYVAVRSGRLNQMVIVSHNAVRQEGSSVYLSEGERQSLRNLVYALMLRSGNDAATAIAEHLAGSSDKFAEQMNGVAHELKLSHSHFMNPHGLDHPSHYSSAHDMAVITAAALRDPIFRSVVATKYYTIPWPNQKWERKMKNKNKLLWRLPMADGVKTGYTKLAGRCLASSATRDGQQVAAVVLRAPDDWNDSVRLLQYGLTHYPRRDLSKVVPLSFQAGVRFGERKTVALKARDSVFYPLSADELPSVEMKVVRLRKLNAPVRMGDIAGAAEYTWRGQVLGRTSLVAAESVRAKGWLGRLQEFLFGR